MKHSLFGQILTFVRYGRVPKILDNFYVNRLLFTKIVRNISKEFGREFNTMLNDSGSPSQVMNKYPNIYRRISRVDHIIVGLSGSDVEILEELVNNKIIDVNEFNAMKKIIGE